MGWINVYITQTMGLVISLVVILLLTSRCVLSNTPEMRSQQFQIYPESRHAGDNAWSDVTMTYMVCALLTLGAGGDGFNMQWASDATPREGLCQIIQSVNVSDVITAPGYTHYGALSVMVSDTGM